MKKICLFAGTTEGRKIAEFLRGQPISVQVHVATGYGESLIRPGENLHLFAGRLSEEEMEQLFGTESFDLVIDATHPYAEAVTGSIAKACRSAGTEYLRVIRASSEEPEDAYRVPDAASAAAFLDRTDGPVFLTTGSKELAVFSRIRHFQERVYARVLPAVPSIEACLEAGLSGPHIMAMQGPFSEELNLAMLKAVQAKWLVTKESGSAGGFEAKARAAARAGAKLLVIGRPKDLCGVTYEEAVRLLEKRFGCARIPDVAAVGIGPGSRDVMTLEAADAIREADCLIGARRMLEAASLAGLTRDGQAVFEEIDPDRIAGLIREHPAYTGFAVLMSGDTSFYSGTKRLLPLLGGCRVRVLPGISSLSYLCSKLHLPVEEIRTISLHGRSCDPQEDVRNNRYVFALVGGEDGVRDLCRKLKEAGLGLVRMYVGEKLSYPDETITAGTAMEMAGRQFDPLSAVLIVNDASCAISPDHAEEKTERKSNR